MRVLSVVGARPQFVKLAPVAAAFRSCGIDHVIVHTGQHYDHRLSDVFFDDLGIDRPDVNLAIGSGSHGTQTGRMLKAIEPVLSESQPDWVLVYGDTNSTLAAALAAIKLHLPLAHLEAGLRSFNRRMPEEHNRVLTDHAADLLLAPTALALAQLGREGLASRSVLVGDVMTDVCLATRDAVRGRPPALPAGVDPNADFVLATIHRADNTDDPERLAAIVAAFQAMPVPVVVMAHPRLRAKAEAVGIDIERGAVRVSEPLAYPDLIAALAAARAVVTDSGGLQKEAYLLGVPCTTVRTETEWVETLQHGWNILHHDVTDLAGTALRSVPDADRGDPYGDGHAAEAVARTLLEWDPQRT
jgi:UDP-N-acetylglucosamine 2-epimerase (non-hydrolysing)